MTVKLRSLPITFANSLGKPGGGKIAFQLILIGGLNFNRLELLDGVLLFGHCQVSSVVTYQDVDESFRSVGPASWVRGDFEAL
jgi:hypothetical protein